ncbi:MAG TPA: glucose 1-dehydrogenase [Thermomicrobiales bacterium]|nr:glucose 1-dehydrogenase [Thermomicrobiales bacterium]
MSTTTTVAAIAVHPGQAGTLRQTRARLPELGPTDVLVDTIRVGVCGTDREIIRGDLGEAPKGTEELVIGHEVVGRVAAIGSAVTAFAPGQIVTATVRRPDDCPACQAGEPDMCLWLKYTERGIFREPGFMAERFVEDQHWLIPVPDRLVSTAVLIEPLTVVEKAVRQAELIQRRLKYWNLQKAMVIGAGPIGLLGTLLLRSRGADVTTLARTPAPNPAANIVTASGARYVSTQNTTLDEIAAGIGNIDVIIESSGNAEIAMNALRVLGNNGVEVLLSITGGTHSIALPADQMNASLVLGNKTVVGSVNAGAIDFVNAVTSLDRFEELWPGLTERFITNRLPFGPDLDLDRIAHKSPNEIKTVIEFRD